jgi:DNA-binding protein H-NS
MKTFDITDDLKTLEDRTRELRTKQKIAIGEVIIAIGIEKLFTVVELAGLLLDAIDRAKANPSLKEGWARRGEAFFFRRKSKSGNGAASNGGGRGTLPSKPANPATVATKPKSDAPDLLSRAHTD